MHEEKGVSRIVMHVMDDIVIYHGVQYRTV